MHVTTLQQPVSAVARRLRIASCVALAICLWVRTWRFPDASASPVLDPSFLQGLGYALLHRLQFGTEIVYTYGPLGWFNGTPHQPELDWIAYWGWELALKLAISVFFGLAAFELRSWWTLLAFAAVLLVPELGNDTYYFLAIAAIGAWTIPRATRGPFVWIAPLLVLVVIALDKFTYTLLALVVVACIAGASGGISRAARIAGTFALTFVAAWWALGQSPLSLPAWFATSVGLTAAYGTAQSVAPSPLLLTLAVIVLVLATATISSLWKSARGGPVEQRRNTAMFSLAWLAGLLLAYKAGFTRASGNEMCLFAFAAPALFLLRDPSAALRSRPVVVALRTATYVAAVAGIVAAARQYGQPPSALLPAAWSRVGQNVGTAFAFEEHEAMRERERAELAHKYRLPRMKALVGDATIDLFGSEQAFVFLNDMRWHPRPLFQGFCVMTDAFSAANARFLAGSDAPRFMLYLPDSIDFRLPGMEDARSLATMLRDYRVALRERGMLLFERRSDAPRNDRRELVLEREIRPGEELDLSGLQGDVLELEVRIRPDLSGRLRALALGAPVLWLETRTTEGVEREYRVVPAMMEYGSIVRPWLQSPGDWVDFLAGEPVHALASVRFAADTTGWSVPFVVRVWRADELVPEHDASTDALLRWSMFTPPPDSFESPKSADPTVLRGYIDALVVQAPSALTWRLAPGAYRLHAQYGFLPSAWREGPTDGAIARVELRRGGGKHDVLFERKLDPKHDLLDSKLMVLDLDVRVEAGDEVSLTTDPGPAGDTERDLLFWTEVAFTPVR